MSTNSPWFYLFDGEGAAAAPAAEAPAAPAAPAAAAPAAAAPTSVLGTPGAPLPAGDAPAGLPDGHAFATLSADLQADPNLAKFAGSDNPLEALATGYRNAAGMIGKDPGSLVDVGTLKEPEAITAHLRTLGAPDAAAGYALTLPEGVDASLGEGPVIDAMREAAAKVGMLPHQFQEVVGAAVGLLGEAGNDDSVDTNKMHADNIAALQHEHGKMFDNQIALANLALEKAGGESAKELAELMASSGIATNPALINFLARVGEGYTEDSAAGFAGSGGAPVAAATALAEADSLQFQAVSEQDPARQRELMGRAVELRRRAYGE